MYYLLCKIALVKNQSIPGPKARLELRMKSCPVKPLCGRGVTPVKSTRDHEHQPVYPYAFFCISKSFDTHDITGCFNFLNQLFILSSGYCQISVRPNAARIVSVYFCPVKLPSRKIRFANHVTLSAITGHLVMKFRRNFILRDGGDDRS